jgi:hypothetical protein
MCDLTAKERSAAEEQRGDPVLKPVPNWTSEPPGEQGELRSRGQPAAEGQRGELVPEPTAGQATGRVRGSKSLSPES